MKVLIVDDEMHVIEGLKASINWEKIGIDKVVYALNGMDAWNLFCDEGPDIVITDVYMPRMNGLKLISNIREVDKNIPVIIYSGYNDFEYASEAITFGLCGIY
jgi:YesN/AraC family two-component response regulator